MGRKNKLKLLKHGSQSLNASAIGDSDGLNLSNDSHQPDFESLTTHLREWVSTGPASKHKELHVIVGELKKKGNELSTAKKVIKQLRSEATAAHQGEGDASMAVHGETFVDAHSEVNVNEELERVKRQADKLTEEREKLEEELKDAREKVLRLEDEVKNLEINLENTNQVFDEGRKKSKQFIEELESSLLISDQRAEDLLRDIFTHQSSHSVVCAELKKEKETRVALEQEMNECFRVRDKIESKLRQALIDVDSAKLENSNLMDTVNELRQDRSLVIQQLVIDGDKLETRYESINSGVQLIKKDFDALKNELFQVKEHNEELRHQLIASKADVKHYRDDGDACRKYIKKIESQLQKLQLTEEETEKTLAIMKTQLQESSETVTNSESLLSELKIQLEVQGSYSDIVDAVKKVKEELEIEKRKNVFNLAAVSAKEAAYQRIVQQNANLFEEVKVLTEKFEQLQTVSNSNETLFQQERKKLTEEVASAKLLLKKVRKEKDNSVRKLKRMLDVSSAEKAILSEQNRVLEEKAAASNSDDSLNSQYSDSYEALEESIKVLKVTVQNTNEKVAMVSKELSDKEKEISDLHRTAAAYKATVDDYEQKLVENENINAASKLRFLELQRSSQELKKFYEEDLQKVHQKLELTERALEIQQELNAEKNCQSEELQQKYQSDKCMLEDCIRELKAAITSQAAEIFSEKEALLEEKHQLQSQTESLQCELLETERANQIINEELLLLKNAVNTAETEKRENAEQISLLSQKLLDSECSKYQTEIDLSGKNNKLEADVEALRKQVMAQDIEIEKLSENLNVSDLALEELTKFVNQTEKDHEKVLLSERAKFDILVRKLEEKTTESSERERYLEEEKRKVQEITADFKKISHLLKEKVQQTETELTGLVSERMSLEVDINNLKALVSQKNDEIDKANREISNLLSKQKLLESEIDAVGKTIADATSSEKEKVLQLESRLEVTQTESRAQCKMLEDELSSTRASLKLTIGKNEDLEKQVCDLLQKTQLIDEVAASSNQKNNKQLMKAEEVSEMTADLEKGNDGIQTEDAGLVNELIDAKEKLYEAEKLIKSLQDQREPFPSDIIKNEEVPQEASENIKKIEDMFPSMDPAVRQLVVLLSENRNYTYGVLGLVIYGFLIHFYIFFLC